jgi:predicted DNA-binding transcriptional regulator AlpA
MSKQRKQTCQKLILTVPEFCQLAGMSRRSFERWREQTGRPRTIVHTPGRLGVPRSELDALLEGTLFEEGEVQR